MCVIIANIDRVVAVVRLHGRLSVPEIPSIECRKCGLLSFAAFFFAHRSRKGWTHTHTHTHTCLKRKETSRDPTSIYITDTEHCFFTAITCRRHSLREPRKKRTSYKTVLPNISTPISESNQYSCIPKFIVTPDRSVSPGARAVTIYPIGRSISGSARWARHAAPSHSFRSRCVKLDILQGVLAVCAVSVLCWPRVDYF